MFLPNTMCMEDIFICVDTGIFTLFYISRVDHKTVASQMVVLPNA